MSPSAALLDRPSWAARLRPSGMTLLIAVALGVTHAVATVGSRPLDPREGELARERRAEQIVHQDLEELGFAPLSSPDTARLQARQGTEILVAGRPFRLELFHGPITGTPPAPGVAERVARIVATELERYPAQTLVGCRLRRVLIAAELAEGGRSIPSLPNYQQSLLLDVSSPESHLRRLIHHEVFHFLDYADDNQLERDPAWDALNGPFFVYGGGGRSMRSGDSNGPGAPGFVTRYAMAGLEEDKAEVFSLLLSAPETIRRLAREDAVIHAKVVAVQRQAEVHVSSWNGAFWREVAAGRR